MHSSAATLLRTLFTELFQTERSAEAHPAREAKRLGPVPPARALERISRHAESYRARWKELAARRGASESGWGRFAGEALSIARLATVDRLVEAERSYRGTLAGIRHGVDLVHLLRSVAVAEADGELVGACDEWLREREALVAEVVAAMEWFARHPDIATKHPWPGAGTPLVRSSNP